jgi:hypothetical protein
MLVASAVNSEEFRQILGIREGAKGRQIRLVGIISDTPAATPIPTAVILFATGLLGLLFFNYRRKRVAIWKIA